MEPDRACLAMAKKHNVTLLRTGEATSTIVSSIIAYFPGKGKPPSKAKSNKQTASKPEAKSKQTEANRKLERGGEREGERVRVRGRE
jgi:hypothetical protein